MDAILRLRFIPLNARLRDSRIENGWTQNDLSLLTGLSTRYISAVETLRAIPSQEAMDELSSAFDKPKEYLFPQSLMDALREGLFDHRVTELKEAQIIRLVEARRAGLLPSGVPTEVEEINDLPIPKELIREVIAELTPQEQRVLELRFGLKDGRSCTLEEIGSEMGVTRERIRQIEARALRRLRHPRRKKMHMLKDFI